MKRKVFAKAVLTIMILLATMTVMASERPDSEKSKGITQQPSALTIDAGDHYVHIMPTPTKAAELAGNSRANSGLIYHGGPVMTKANFYAIFWNPGTLQNGATTGFSNRYLPVLDGLLTQYPGHGIDNNNTQYSETAEFCFYSCTWYAAYIQNAGGFAGSFVDNDAYPSSGCYDDYTGYNCITDAQLQAEIQKVMNSQGWSGGLNNMFLVFTSSGEGSCASFGCAYTYYCGYHSDFKIGNTPVVYANVPYANYCESGAPSPNNDPIADAAANIASHEMSEAITDPELNAWYDSSGNEIGDKCAWNYGANAWDSGNANQFWGSTLPPQFLFTATLFELQQEWDNHTMGCTQVGP